jgi:PEP-CTERM motif
MRMMFAVRALGVLAAVSLAVPALATPLNLNVGDVVTQIEWSSTNGGSYTQNNPSLGTANVMGDLDSVTIAAGPTTNSLTGVTFQLDVDLLSQSVFPLGGPFFAANVIFGGSSAIQPDFTVSDNTGIILQGNLTGSLQLAGVVNVLNPNAEILGFTSIVITGGDSNLVDALGGLGGTGVLNMTGAIQSFSPNLATLLADLNAFNSNFTFSGTGIITPDVNAPFVPEPSTALMLAGGLLALLAASRRAARRV